MDRGCPTRLLMKDFVVSKEKLNWARANGCPWKERTCDEIAAGGHLEVLQWARANGCPWNEYTCKAAARRGHLEVLQWARENGTARGMEARVRPRPGEAIWRCCSGPEQTDARGMQTRAGPRPREAIWRC